MNVSPDRRALDPLAAGSSRLQRVVDILLGKVMTLVLAALALLLAMATFVLLAGGGPVTLRPGLAFALLLANAAVLLLQGALQAGLLTPLWVERRRGSAG